MPFGSSDDPRRINETKRQESSRRASDMTDEHNNPCLKEQEMTYKCLDKNFYDYSKCVSVVENYKRCKGFWLKVKNDRRRRGLSPFLPLPEDREKIKTEYLNKN